MYATTYGVPLSLFLDLPTMEIILYNWVFEICILHVAATKKRCIGRKTKEQQKTNTFKPTNPYSWPVH